MSKNVIQFLEILENFNIFKNNSRTIRYFRDPMRFELTRAKPIQAEPIRPVPSIPIFSGSCTSLKSNFYFQN